MTDQTHKTDTYWLVAALYKFVPLDGFRDWQAPIQQACAKHNIMGTLLLAQEGINGTISGQERDLRDFIAWLRTQDPFADIEVKYSKAADAPFYRMKVRLKKEIVTLGVGNINPMENAGTYVMPEDWNALISEEDVVVVDTRNDYEVAIGTFEGATDPQTTSFRELPEWVENKLEADPETKIAMFCTGGIRCEKSTAYLKSKGYKNVYHLKGGILKYLETVPEEESLWRGQCFVFDQRVSVGHGLKQGEYDLCHACRMPITAEDKRSPLYQTGISCPHCHDKMSAEQRARFAERQKQITLAKARDASHIAADISGAKAAKRAKKEAQRERSQKLDVL